MGRGAGCDGALLDGSFELPPKLAPFSDSLLGLAQVEELPPVPGPDEQTIRDEITRRIEETEQESLDYINEYAQECYDKYGLEGRMKQLLDTHFWKGFLAIAQIDSNEFMGHYWARPEMPLDVILSMADDHEECLALFNDYRKSAADDPAARALEKQVAEGLHLFADDLGPVEADELETFMIEKQRIVGEVLAAHGVSIDNPLPSWDLAA